MISTVDREARYTRKSKSRRRDGFRGHVAAEPETGLITDCEMTMRGGPRRLPRRRPRHRDQARPLRPALPGGFTIDDFTIDGQADTVTCPAGHAMPMSARTRTVNFGGLCAACPLRTRCTTAKDGRSTRIYPHEDLLRAARAQARTSDFKKAYPTRSAIERIISWTATVNGRRVRLRYLGAARNNAWLRTRCAAINLRTLLRHGLTRRDRAWILT